MVNRYTKQTKTNEDIANIKEIDRLKTYLSTLPGVDKVITFSEYLKLVNYCLNHFDPKFYALPEEGFELRMLINNFDVVLGNDTLSRFMTSDFSRTNLLLLTHLSSSKDFLETKIQDRTKQLRQAVMELDSMNKKLKEAYIETIYSLTRATEYKDEETAEGQH